MVQLDKYQGFLDCLIEGRVRDDEPTNTLKWAGIYPKRAVSGCMGISHSAKQNHEKSEQERREMKKSKFYEMQR